MTQRSFAAALRSPSGCAWTVFGVLLVATIVGCSRDTSVDLGEAERLIAGPRAAGFVVFDSAGAPRRLAADGTLVGTPSSAVPAGCFAMFEAPQDLENDASDASILLVPPRDVEGESTTLLRWRRDGSVETVATIPLFQTERARPLCAGTHENGILESNFLTLVIEDAEAPRRALVVDVKTGASEIWPNALFEPTPQVISVSPTGNWLVVVRQVGDTSEMLVASRTAAEAPRVIEAVEPIAPYWLTEVPVLLFVRTGGSVVRAMLPKGEPEWLVPGRLSSDLPRSDVAVRGEDMRRIHVEKVGFGDFAQITWIDLFAAGSEREKAITNGGVDHYGSVWSTDRKAFAFRQRERQRGERAEDERIVVVDTADGYASTALCSRRVPPTQEQIGPEFQWRGPHLFVIVDGRLRRFELDLSADSGD